MSDGETSVPARRKVLRRNVNWATLSVSGPLTLFFAAASEAQSASEKSGVAGEAAVQWSSWVSSDALTQYINMAIIFCIPYGVSILLARGLIYLHSRAVGNSLDAASARMVSVLAGLLLVPAVTLVVLFAILPPLDASFSESAIEIAHGAFFGAVIFLISYFVVAPVSTGLGAVLLCTYLWRGRNISAWIWCSLVIVTIFLEVFYLSNLGLDSFH